MLIDEGDLYPPRRGELAMAVPLFGNHILRRYRDARLEATTSLLSLEETRANATSLPRPPSPRDEGACDEPDNVAQT